MIYIYILNINIIYIYYYAVYTFPTCSSLPDSYSRAPSCWPRPPGPLTTSCGSVTEATTTIRRPQWGERLSSFSSDWFTYVKNMEVSGFQVILLYNWRVLRKPNDWRDVHKERFEEIEVEGGKSRLVWPGTWSMKYEIPVPPKSLFCVRKQGGPGSNSLLYFFLH